MGIVISDLKDKKNFGTFYEKKKIQKTNHQELKIGKVIKKREQVLCQMERS